MTTRRPHPLPPKQIIALCVLLFGLVVGTFLPARHNEFVNYDDDRYLLANTHVQQGLSAAAVAWAFKTTYFSNWHPLTWMSYLADYEFHGLDPRGYHLTNIWLHGVNAGLLFLLVWRMTGATWRSLFVAAVFGLHPLRVESVAWVSERKDVLAMLFGLLTLLAYVKHAERRQIQASRLTVYYGLTVLGFALSLMSKPMLVTLPFVLLLLDYWPLGRIQNSKFKIQNWFPLLIEKIPLFILAAASCAVTYLAQKQGGAMELMSGMSFMARLENIPVSYCRYLGKFFWPENLAVIYPVVNPWPMSVILTSSVLLLGLTAGAVVLRRSRPYLVTGWLWFLGTLVPMIGLVAVGEQAMADRYTYFPLIGVLLSVTWGVTELAKSSRRLIAGCSAAGAVIIVMCIAVTRQNIGYWKTSETLFQHAIAVTGDNYSAHCNLGNWLLDQGRPEDALGEFQTAARLKPDSPENHCNVGVALANLDRLDEAILAFENAARVKPDHGPAYHNLGMALERKGLLEQATLAYGEAIKLMPGSAAAHNSLGVILAKQNRLDDALAEFTEALRLDPGFAPAQGNLKMALELRSQMPDVRDRNPE